MSSCIDLGTGSISLFFFAFPLVNPTLVPVASSPRRNVTYNVSVKLPLRRWSLKCLAIDGHLHAICSVEAGCYKSVLHSVSFDKLYVAGLHPTIGRPITQLTQELANLNSQSYIAAIQCICVWRRSTAQSEHPNGREGGLKGLMVACQTEKAAPN